MKSADDLKMQWAGGRDVWPKVPLLKDNSGFVHVQTRVKDADEDESEQNWPDIVKQSVLFGFGAYNPRGQTLPDDINDKQHILLYNDITNSIKKYTDAKFWEAASIWEDGSSEKGFILAFGRNQQEEGLQLSVNLARKYDQGAIYQFNLEDGKLMRDTIAVLDDGTEARVEVIMDSSVDISPFLK